MKRSIALLLLGALLANSALLFGCGEQTPADGTGTPDTAVTDPSSADTTAPEAETVPPTSVDSLPADLNFDGQNVGIASSVNVHYHGYMDVAESDTSTSVLDQSIYERNRAVEERLGITITEHTDAASNVIGIFKKTVQAGDDTYSIAHLADRDAFNTGLEGYLLNIDTDMPFIDLEKDYWYQEGNEVLRVADKQYAVFGEMSLGTYDYTHLLAFNQSLINKYNLESPYTYFENGNWTFETFASLITAVHDDLDGDGVMTDKDCYGYHSRDAVMYPLMYTAAGLRTVVNNEEGIPEFAVPGNETFVDVYDWCIATFYDGKAWYPQGNGSDFLTKSPMFQENKALFTDISFFYVGSIREMVSDFGIIVYPKYTAEQERYYSWVEGGAKALGISRITENKEAVGAALEAMGTLSLSDVIPTYYEINLKTKYSRDEISSRMFDVIRDSRAFDLGDTVWCNSVRELLGGALKNQTPISSMLAKVQKSVDAQIANAMKKLEAKN